MQLLVLPRGTNAEELFAAGAKIDSKGKLIFTGFQAAEIPLSTSLLMYDTEDKYTQHTLTSALTLLSSDMITTENSLPNPKNSLPTSRCNDWVTSHLRGDYNPDIASSTKKKEKRVHFERADKESKKKKHKEKSPDHTTDSKSEKTKSESSRKESKESKRHADSDSDNDNSHDAKNTKDKEDRKAKKARKVKS